MPYTSSTLYPKQLVRVAGEPVTWTYTSADTIGTIDGTGYFTNGNSLGMLVGDTVIIHSSIGGTSNSAMRRVITSTALGAASVSVT